MLTNTFKYALIAAALLSVQLPAQTRRMAHHQTPSHSVSHHASRPAASRIPERHFRSNFGRDHQFRANRASMAHGFRHGGVSFRMAQAWPMGWRDSDPVYVSASGGSYYLYNQYRPNEAVALNVDECDACGESEQAEVPTVARGMNGNQVVAILGSPSNVIDQGPRQIWIYDNMRVLFFAGRVIDAR